MSQKNEEWASPKLGGVLVMHQTNKDDNGIYYPIPYNYELPSFWGIPHSANLKPMQNHIDTIYKKLVGLTFGSTSNAVYEDDEVPYLDCGQHDSGLPRAILGKWIINKGDNMATTGLGLHSQVNIRQVSNGYIITVGYCEYVFQSLKSALKFIEKNYTPKKED